MRLYAKSSEPQERIFFISPQTRTAPRRNAFGYGRRASGLTIGEYDQAGNAIREYVWLGSTPVAMFTPDPANAGNPPIAFYFHTDHLNTPRVVTDTAGNIRWRWMAEPFGTTAPETNPSGLGVFTQPLRFPGQYADMESGLAYNWNRNADFTINRFTQVDPIGLAGGSMSPYVDVNNNPLTYADPRGLCIEDLCIGEAIFVGRILYQGYRWYQLYQVASNAAKTVATVSTTDSEEKSVIVGH